MLGDSGIVIKTIQLLPQCTVLWGRKRVPTVNMHCVPCCRQLGME